MIALLMNPDNLNYDVDVKAAQEAARSLDQQTMVVDAKHPGMIDAAFDTIAQKRAAAILVASDPMFLGQRDRLAALAARYALPVVAWTREFAAAGLLCSYGTSIVWMYREAGVYAGRILKGAKPSNLPVIQPSIFSWSSISRRLRRLGLRFRSRCCCVRTR